MICAFVGSLGMPLSGRHNALYGREDFVAALPRVCRAGLAASAAVVDMGPTLGIPRVPAPQRFPGMIAAVDRWGGEGIPGAAVQDGQDRDQERPDAARRMLAAAGCRRMPFTGKTGGENTVPGRPGGGTSGFEGHMAARHGGMPGLLAPAVRRITDGMGRAEGAAALPSAVSRPGVAVRILHTDGGFCTVAAMAAVRARRQRFLAAAPQNSGMARAVDKRVRKSSGRPAGTPCSPTTGTGPCSAWRSSGKWP